MIPGDRARQPPDTPRWEAPLLDLVLLLLAERLASGAGMVAREPAVLPAFGYERKVALAPGDPDFLLRYPCPEGTRPGGVPIFDCTGDEVCLDRAYACWKGGSIVPGLSTGWFRGVLIHEGPTGARGPDAEWGAWWGDGSPREWRRPGADGGTVLQRWERDGSRYLHVRLDNDETNWMSAGPEGWLRREVSIGSGGEERVREWRPDGTPWRFLRHGDADGPGLAVEWDEAGRVVQVSRLHRGRPTGPLFLRTAQGWVVESWAAGRLLDVWTPPAFHPPEAREGLACPAGAWEATVYASAPRLVQCQTLSGVPLGPGVSYETGPDAPAAASRRWVVGPDGRELAAP